MSARNLNSGPRLYGTSKQRMPGRFDEEHVTLALQRESMMPLYFFNVHDGKAIPDDTGTELAGIDEAHEEAVKLAGALLRDHGTKFWKGNDWSIDVADETGKTLCSMRFSSSIHDADDPAS